MSQRITLQHYLCF